MKKIILLISIFAVLSNAKPLIFDVCKDWCFQYKFEDVKNWKWLTNEVNGSRFIRLTFFDNRELDLNVGNYDVKISK